MSTHLTFRKPKHLFFLSTKYRFYRILIKITETMNSYEDIYKTICRVCLSHSKCDNMVSLFDKNDSEGLSCYGKSVITFANVFLKFEDNLPQLMCKNCVLLLKQAIRFKFKCENSDAKLKRLMKIKRSTKQNYHEILCQYTLFNYYFPEKSIKKSSGSIHKSRPTISVEKLTENIINSQNINNEKVVNNINKTEKTICGNYKENNLLDYNNDTHDDQQSQEINCEENEIGYEDDLLNKLEKMFNSDIDISESTYINKFTRNKQKKLMSKSNIKKPTTFFCTTCEKVIKNRLTYKRHMQRHNGCRFICESCGKPFPTLTELNMHQIASHGIGPYLQCDLCPYKAPRKLNLIEHIRLHTGERPYTCEKCGLTFRRKAIWRKHLIYHTEKNFQCPHCPKKFFRQCAMLSHINNIHDRLYVFMCNKCGATYAKTMTVRRHLSEKHGIPRELQGKIVRVLRNPSPDNPLK